MADIDDIINTLIAEAYGEGPEGMRRVAETIINRGAIRDLTPAEVVRQPSQYTGYWSPGPAAVQAQQDPRARAAAQDAWTLALQEGDPTGGADHYFNPDVVSPSWADQMTLTGDYGNHRYYSSRPIPPAALNNSVATALDVTGPRVAPTPFMPPARGNVPSSLIADSLARVSAAQGRAQIEDMFGPVTDATPRLNRRGAVIDPAGIVFGPQMETDIFPSTRRTISASDLARGKSGISTIASIPTRPQISASDLARGKSGISTIAAIPTTGVGAPPATRAVASVPVSPRDPVGTMPKFSDLANMFGGGSASAAIDHSFGPSVPGPAGYTNDNKDQARLAPGQWATAPASLGGIDPTLLGFAPIPRPAGQGDAARKKAETTKTVTETILNPDWTAALATTKVPAGMPVNFGSRDTVAQRAAGVQVAKNIPKYITRTRQVPVVPRPPVARTPLRVVVEGASPLPSAPAPKPSGRGTSVVQAIRNAEGVTAQQAYDLANERAAERARQNAGPSGYSTITSGDKRFDATTGNWV